MLIEKGRIRVLSVLAFFAFVACNSTGGSALVCTQTPTGTLICTGGATTTAGGTGTGGGGSATPVSGTCNMITYESACFQYVNETPTALAVYQSVCVLGTWSSGLTCPAPNVTGTCTYASDAGEVQYYYTTSSTLEPLGFNSVTAKTFCQAQTGAIWVP